jgi:hypothetical protein
MRIKRERVIENLTSIKLEKLLFSIGARKPNVFKGCQTKTPFYFKGCLLA